MPKSKKTTPLASANRAAKSTSKTTKQKLKTFLKIGAGLGGAALLAYAAKLGRSAAVARVVKEAAKKTADARATTLNGAPTTKGLLSKVKTVLKLGALGAAGAAGAAGAVAAKKRLNSKRKNLKRKNLNNMMKHVRHTTRPVGLTNHVRIFKKFNNPTYNPKHVFEAAYNNPLYKGSRG